MTAKWWFGAATALAAMPGLAQTPTPPAAERDWGALLAADARGVADVVRDHHPGAVDPMTPGFARVVAAGLAEALRRSRHVSDRDGYFWALREYLESFNDGRLYVSYGAMPPSPYQRRWPGFLTRESAGQQLVTVTRSADLPPLGARLIACDGIAARALVDQNVGRFAGRWSLRSRRESDSLALFVDRGIPYIRLPRRCAFDVGGRRRAYRLSWRPLSDSEWQSAIATPDRPSAGIGLRAVDGGFWIGLGSFNDGNAEDLARLTSLLETLRPQRDAIRRSAFIVLDLRGNNGGSSFHVEETARILWGEDHLAAHRPQFEAIDWRVSSANIAHVESLVQRMRADGQDDLAAAHARIAAGMRAALADGRPFYRQLPPARTVSPGSSSPGITAPAYVITDLTCSTACVDAVEMWKALGAIQVGRETSGDTFYMEVRRFELPSGLSFGMVPINVVRGRARGSNAPMVPELPFENLADTPGLERLIIADARRRR